MAGMTTFLQTKLLDHALRNIAWTSPTSVLLGLFSVTPGDDGTGGTELVGGGYARKTVTMGADTDGVMYNTAIVQFDVPASIIVAGGIFDNSGNMLWVAPFSTPRSVPAGTYTLAAGYVVVKLG